MLYYLLRNSSTLPATYICTYVLTYGLVYIKRILIERTLTFPDTMGIILLSHVILGIIISTHLYQHGTHKGLHVYTTDTIPMCRTMMMYTYLYAWRRCLACFDLSSSSLIEELSISCPSRNTFTATLFFTCRQTHTFCMYWYYMYSRYVCNYMCEL